MLLFIKLFIISFVIFFAIDLIWLGVIAKNLYQKYIGKLLKKDVNWVAAIVFYLLFIAGLVLFVLIPGVDKNSLSHVMIYGVLFGFITYATYDLTNLATLKDWPKEITLIDLAWGTFLGFSTSTISYLLFQLIF
ncbi:hypothetical protein BK010_05800 [Tenericutes bacterium MO-XQ]|nr:hypothetical protein BK010_05800 [Tenericutes bacterium MO-XQ]